MSPRQKAAAEHSEVAFVAGFEGPAVEAGRMNARDFAPSLFATSSLVEAAAEAFTGVPGSVTLQVKADFRRGSFEFGLVAAAVFVGQQLLQNLSVSDLQVMLRGIGVLGRDPKSLFRLLLEIGDKPIQRIEQSAPGAVTIHISGDNNNVVIGDVDQRVARLLTNPTVREALPEVVAPVTRPGIEAFRVGEGRRAALRITKKDVPKFRPPATLKSELADGVATTAVELLSPNFVDGNKWRVAQGGDSFWVRMLDDHFLEAMDRGDKSFTKGDYLIVELRTRAYSTPEGLTVDREILRVLDHKHRARQLGLG
jgi:hypothetical protein